MKRSPVSDHSSLKWRTIVHLSRRVGHSRMEFLELRRRPSLQAHCQWRQEISRIQILLQTWKRSSRKQVGKRDVGHQMVRRHICAPCWTEETRSACWYAQKEQSKGRFCCSKVCVLFLKIHAQALTPLLTDSWHPVLIRTTTLKRYHSVFISADDEPRNAKHDEGSKLKNMVYCHRGKLLHFMVATERMILSHATAALFAVISFWYVELMLNSGRKNYWKVRNVRTGEYKNDVSVCGK